ncbi:MAG: RNA methyltransferase [Deltaproteobacteria bacterium]|nr:RNA methyltransferase [Deltaproteobacteria bacterium]
MRLYMGLVHYPVYNKNHERIASAVTTFDLHDLSRLAKTYGVKRFYVITPLEDQQELADRVVRHWTEGYGASYNPNRKEALELVSVLTSIDDCVREVTQQEGKKPALFTTDASQKRARVLSYREASDMVLTDKVILLLFGTAWGLSEEVFDRSGYFLAPITTHTDYNHLSVRSAAAIILDRLAGKYPRGQ